MRKFPDILQALIFCLQWPDPGLGADLVLSRSGELDGEAYDILTAAADLLEPEHPLAATLVWRSMIGFALEQGRSKRYRHAARHLDACARVEAVIRDYGPHPNHVAFTEALRRSHSRKHAFWDKVSE